MMLKFLGFDFFLVLFLYVKNTNLTTLIDYDSWHVVVSFSTIREYYTNWFIKNETDMFRYMTKNLFCITVLDLHSIS